MLKTTQIFHCYLVICRTISENNAKIVLSLAVHRQICTNAFTYNKAIKIQFIRINLNFNIGWF